MEIITDEERLRRVSRETDAEECKRVHLFELLDVSLKESEVEGVGLSAIQIDIPLRASIIRLPQCNINMINPKIEKADKLSVFRGEGCLSFPNRYLNTDRYNQCVVSWIDEKGNEKRGAFEGLEAIVVQHEIDHMDGVLMFDRQTQPIVRKERKIGRNESCPCGSGKKYKKCCGR